MQLHTDESHHLRKVNAPSSVGIDWRRDTLHPQPAPCTLPLTEFLDERKCVLRRGDYSIFLADSPRKCSEASVLIKRMYAWRGYHTENAKVSSSDSNQPTFVAYRGKDLAGTLTLRLDSAQGLLADELYEEEIDVFRAKGRKIFELSKLAVDPLYSSKEMLASLFHLAHIYGHILHKVTDLFIEVNPRHTGFYKRMLGLRQIGEILNCQRVDAPAALMHLELDYVDEKISALAGSCEPKEKSLYPYFFPKHEEEKTADRISLYIDRAMTLDSVALSD